MKALIFDEKTGWDASTGFDKIDVEKPTLDKNNEADQKSVIIKVHYAGVCGSDRGIWYRKSFKDQILGSLKDEKKSRRVIGHEFFGEIVEVGENANAVSISKLSKGDFATSES